MMNADKRSRGTSLESYKKDEAHTDIEISSPVATPKDKEDDGIATKHTSGKTSRKIAKRDGKLVPSNNDTQAMSPQWADALIDIAPLPQEGENELRSQSEQGPGAYSVGGRPACFQGTINTASRGSDIESQVPISTSNPVSTSNTGLAVARPVQDTPGEDDSYSERPMTSASQVDLAHIQMKLIAREKQRRRESVHLLVLFVFLAIVLVGVLTFVAVAVHRGGSKDTNSQQQHQDTLLSTTPQPTMLLSEVPSLAPTGSMDLLLQDLPEYTLHSLTQASSPQWLAMAWLERHPHLEVMELWRLKQLFALATFFYSLQGPHWRREIKKDWLHYDKHECDWFSSAFGNFKSGKYFPIEVDPDYRPCNEHGEFQALGLENLELDARSSPAEAPQLPPQLGLLTSLSSIGLALNGINSTLEEFLPLQTLQQLPNLRVLNLVENHLQGSIPTTHLSLLTNAQELGLCNNTLTGTIPSQLGLLTSLQELYINENQLTGSIPTAFGQMTALEYLFVRQNALTGTIPSQLGLLTNMYEMWLRANQLTGSLPSSLGRLTAMVELSVRNNALTGSLFTELGQLTKLKELYCRENFLSGPLPSQLGLLTMLKEVALRNNAFTGAVFTEIGLLTNLKALYLRENAMTGVLPSQLGLLTKIEELSVRNNGFTGSIFTEIGRLANLTDLYLRENSMTGALPSELGLLTLMTELSARNNAFSGSLPTQLGQLTMMTAMYLNENVLSGPIPSTLGLLKALVEFDLDVNSLTGSLPSQLGAMEHLKELDVSNNAITGTVPVEMGLPDMLSTFRMTGNTLLGTLPEDLCSLELFTEERNAGISFDCSQELCGCSWCACSS